MAALVDWIASGAAYGSSVGALVLIKGTLVLLVAAGTARLLARQSAGTRHLVWILGFAGAFLIAAASLVVPPWRVAILSIRPFPQVDVASGAGSDRGPATIAGWQPDAELSSMGGAGGPEQVGARAAPEVAGLCALWAMGALVMLTRLAVARVAARRLVARASPLAKGPWRDTLDRLAVEMGLARAPELRTSDEISTPLTAGILHPAILLPVASEDWPEERRRAVLAHELAHVSRHDCLTQVMVDLVGALEWPSPAVWWAARRLRIEREMAADDAALGAGARASDYASLLLEMSRGLNKRPTGPAGRAVFSMIGPSLLGERLASLLDHSRLRRGPAPRRAALAAVAVLAMALSLACLQGAGEATSVVPRGTLRLVYTIEPPSDGSSHASLDEIGPRLLERLGRHGVNDVRVLRQDNQLIVELPPARQAERQRIEALYLESAGLRFAAAPSGADVSRRLALLAASDPRARTLGISVGHEQWDVGTDGSSRIDDYLWGSEIGLNTYLAEVHGRIVPEAGHVFALDRQQAGRWRTLYLDLSTSVEIGRAKASVGHDGAGRPTVDILLQGRDIQRVADLTRVHVGDRLVLLTKGERVRAAPVLRGPITDGRAMITLAQDLPAAEEEAHELADTIAGALPTTMRLIAARIIE